MSTKEIFVALMCIGLSACSKDLSRSTAASGITADKTFARTVEIKVPVGNIWWDYRNLNADRGYPLQMLQEKGIISLRESGQKEGYWNKEYITELGLNSKHLAMVPTKDAMPNADSIKSSRCWTTYGHGE